MLWAFDMKPLYLSSVIAQLSEWRYCAIALTLMLAAASAPARADYKLMNGDVLDISVVGFPDLKQRALVGLDGEVVLPLVGPVKVRGATVAEARATITKALAGRTQIQLTVDGRELQHLILPSEVVVQVAEYRPIYVSGDVALPGERPFRPGMTVRQAISLAGGFDRLRQRTNNPFTAPEDFRADYEVLSAQLAAEEAKIWRLRNLLGENVQFSKSSVALPPGFNSRLQEVERDQLQAALDDRDKDGALLRKAIDHANAQMATLSDKNQNDKQASDDDQADYRNVKALFDKGLTASARLSDARRAALLSADQLLQTIVETANVERQRDDYKRLLEKAQNQARIDTLKDLEASVLRAAEIAVRLKSAEQKLKYVGVQPRPLEDLAGEPSIVVNRIDESGAQTLTADEDKTLMPGDVVVVTLDAKISTGLGATARAQP
ncbi:MAG TPA: polysaccharide biosynthesis/export family protein [Roseiarcus sp.]|nr:polysaccharide biosynthesis/export family protein [Roseiarcus sp.]